jgi:hypothetical protein
VTRARNAIGDRALIQHPRDEQALAGKKTHGTSITNSTEVSHGALWQAQTLPADAAVLIIRPSLNVEWAVIPAHFFWLDAFRPVAQ